MQSVNPDSLTASVGVLPAAAGTGLPGYATSDVASFPGQTTLIWPAREEPASVVARKAQIKEALTTLQANGWQNRRIASWQRGVEMAVAASIMLLTAPIIALLCIIIRCDSRGPVFFRQWRVGQGGRLFRFTKLRTLHADARERWPQLYAYDYTPEELERLRFKVPNDPRVTRVGHWLRASTLDELPNLWHVLAGDMALVGPRPEIPEMLPYYTADTMRKFSVRPGVTGLAQVSARGHLTFHQTVAFDVGYVDQHNLKEDARILAMTIVRLAQRRGAF